MRTDDAIIPGSPQTYAKLSKTSYRSGSRLLRSYDQWIPYGSSFRPNTKSVSSSIDRYWHDDSSASHVLLELLDSNFSGASLFELKRQVDEESYMKECNRQYSRVLAQWHSSNPFIIFLGFRHVVQFIQETLKKYAATELQKSFILSTYECLSLVRNYSLMKWDCYA